MRRVDTALATLTEQLTTAGVPNPICDAEWLLAHVFGCSRTALLLDPARQLTAENVATLHTFTMRRCAREPLQYILGTQDFFGRTFFVTPDVLIPRPETEQLVALSLDRLRTAPAGPVLDIGTGSGCIAITLLCEQATRPLVATDCSASALAVAARNAAYHNVAQRLTLCGPVNCWPATTSTAYAAIVSNPPYLTTAEAAAAQPELLHEPLTALASGADGCEAIRCIVSQAADWLAPGGVLCLEVGATQTGVVAELAHTAGLTHIEQHRDWQGALRFVTAYR